MRRRGTTSLALCCGILGGVACSDYGINGLESTAPDWPPPEWSDDHGPDTGDGIAIIPIERCNGVDDDGDGVIDEGFEDLDNDGVADCVDADCTLDGSPTTTVPLDEDCLSTQLVVAPWDVVVEWQFLTPNGMGVMVMPAVGHLTDDNGDGLVNDADVPDIAFTTWADDHLMAIHGNGDGLIFDTRGINGNGGVAIADVTGDGRPEVIAATALQQITAVDPEGTRLWVSEPFDWQAFPQPTVTDLDRDGTVEVVLDIAVVNGADGSTRTTLDGLAANWRAPVTADLDKDGAQEILLGEHVFNHAGDVQWTVEIDGFSVFAAVVDLDGDARGESIWVSGSQASVHDDDGRRISTIDLDPSTVQPGPPCVADFDGDGDPEVALPTNHYISVYEVDGTRLWTRSVDDTSGSAGCSAFDFDADGDHELIFADHVALYILDGATGDALYTHPDHASGTLWEYPVVADVDADGAAELVLASNGADGFGITVLGHAGDGWAPAGPTWAVHDFSESSVAPDGSVPTPTPDAWDEHNLFRARPTVDRVAVDLAGRLVDSCAAGCGDDSVVRLSMQVDNEGNRDAMSAINVALYALDGAEETLISTQRTAAGLASGRSSDTIEFALTRGLMGPDGVLIRIDDDGSGGGDVGECDEHDNVIIVALDDC